MKDAVKIGLVGAGAIAQLAHLPVLTKMRGASSSTAICDNDRPKARALADRFGIPGRVDRTSKTCSSSRSSTRSSSRRRTICTSRTCSARSRRSDTCCVERPLSLTSRGVERILTAAARAERTVTVANNHRYRTDVQALSRFIEGGELGKIVGVRAGAYHFKRQPEGWRFRRAESGGGAFMDHGVPLLDLALWLADYPDPVRVTTHMDRGRGASAVEEAMVVQLECAGGQSFLFDVSSAYVGEEERWWFEVLAARGSARLAPLRVVKELNGRATNVSPSGAAGRESAFIQSYRAELAHFLAVVRGETDYEPPTDQVVLHRIVEAIYKSAEDGKEVRF